MIKNLFLPLLAGAALFTACGNGEEVGAGTEETPCAAIVKPEVATQIDTLNIIVETSGSMKGFMPTQNRQTAFQQQVDDLLANAEAAQESVEKLRLFTAQNNIRTIGYDRFQSMLRQGLAQAGASTPIPDLLSQIATRYTGPGQVSVFISDFIYSPPDIRDRDYVANDIRRALAPLQDKGMAVAVFGFTSDFKGTFYPAGATNGQESAPVKDCCETEVPYYAWIMGPESAVRMVSEKILRNQAAVAMQSGYDRQAPAYGILPGSGRTGSWYVTDAGSKTMLIDNTQELRQGEVSFTVGLNLQALPTQFAAEEYLEEQLQVKARNGKAQLMEVMSRADFIESEKLSAKDRQLLECYTHLAIIKIMGVDDRNSPINLTLSLPAANPAWADAWTTDDDRNIDEAGARTFAMSEILSGLRELYPQEKEAVFTLDLTIQKAN